VCQRLHDEIPKVIILTQMIEKLGYTAKLIVVRRSKPVSDFRMNQRLSHLSRETSKNPPYELRISGPQKSGEKLGNELADYRDIDDQEHKEGCLPVRGPEVFPKFLNRPRRRETRTDIEESEHENYRRIKVFVVRHLTLPVNCHGNDRTNSRKSVNGIGVVG